MIDDTLQRNARAFPLFVFLSRQFLQPHPRHEERLLFPRIVSGCRIAPRNEGIAHLRAVQQTWAEEKK